MRARFLPLLLLAGSACQDARQTATPRSVPPTAEFILAAGDSAYWVTSDTGGMRMRGAPIELARVDGRFVEVYVVDDDHSFESADLLGQGVYRRDLGTGDSVRVFTDSLVPALARTYGRAHPHEHHLAPDEEGADDPELRATATLEFAGAHGRFVSYTLHTDVERAGQPLWHVSRNGVLDLRSGKPATVADIAGAEAPTLEHQRESMIRVIVDSLRLRSAALAGRYRVDPSSFTITSAEGHPAITYAIPVSGSDDVDHALALPPLPFTEPQWWHDVASTLPASSPDGAQDSWHHASYSVIARYDSTSTGHVVLRDASGREWAIGRISAPATRIFWLDPQSFDSSARHALVRAFDEAANYGSETHVASRHARSPFLLSSLRR